MMLPSRSVSARSKRLARQGAPTRLRRGSRRVPLEAVSLHARRGCYAAVPAGIGMTLASLEVPS